MKRKSLLSTLIVFFTVSFLVTSISFGESLSKSPQDNEKIVKESFLKIINDELK